MTEAAKLKLVPPVEPVSLEDLLIDRIDSLERTVSTLRLRQHFATIAHWGPTNDIGQGLLRNAVRASEPIPHLAIGDEYRIDDELAVKWLRRNFGVNCTTTE